MRVSSILFIGVLACADDKPINEDALWVEADMESRYGPYNSWYHTSISTVQDSGECGYNEGQQACNFTMVDQFGDDVELYQFWGQVIVLDVFAEW
jgi:hypothetical protein